MVLHNKNILYVLVGTLCVLIAAELASGMNEKMHWAIDTSDSSTVRAAVHRIIGVDLATEMSSPQNLRMVTFQDTTVPFLEELHHARRVWQYEDGDMIFESGELGDSSQVTPKEVVILFDSVSGALLKVEILQVGLDSAYRARKPSREFAESQMRGAGRQIWVGLPDYAPDITLAAALRAADLGLGLCPEVIAYYVMFSQMDSPARAVWDIHGYGLPPTPVHSGATIPPEQLTHKRFIVDSETGQLLLSTTVPQPDRLNTDSLLEFR